MPVSPGTLRFFVQSGPRSCPKLPHTTRCGSTATTSGSSTVSDMDVVAPGTAAPELGAPLDWAVEVGGWRVRTFTPEDIPQLIALQAASFHEVKTPVGAVNDFAFRMFEAEVVDAMRCKLRYNKRDHFTMLVIEGREPVAAALPAQAGPTPTPTSAERLQGNQTSSCSGNGNGSGGNGAAAAAATAAAAKAAAAAPAAVGAGAAAAAAVML
ncbi:MAG: hypothetical protein WDW38_005988 [Sanguina aurantia]